MAQKPILLRPDVRLAEAMTAAADAEGVSRQAWMLDVLEQAAVDYIPAGATEADQPLPGT